MSTLKGDIIWALRILKGISVRVGVRRVRVRRRIVRRSALPQHTKKQYAEYRKQAKVLVLERLEYFNQYYQLEYRKVFIKNQKSRWGSCSANKNLNFNYRILFLEKEVQDYLIVHELCHLKEMNHGSGFWSLVGERIPQYKILRKKLRAVTKP